MALEQLNETEIWYAIESFGDQLMLFPGRGMDHQYYRLAVPLLLGNAKLILLDPRGIGQSRKDSPKQVTYTPELKADDFAALAKALKLGNLDILGSAARWRWPLPKSIRNSRAP